MWLGQGPSVCGAATRLGQPRRAARSLVLGKMQDTEAGVSSKTCERGAGGSSFLVPHSKDREARSKGRQLFLPCSSHQQQYALISAWNPESSIDTCCPRVH